MTPTPKAKGTIIVYNRSVIKERGVDFEERFLKQLTPEEKNYYHTALPLTWIPIGIVNRINTILAEMLFPDDPDGLQKLGYQEARHDYSDIYKILLHFASIPFIIRQTAKMWRTYHNTGDGESHLASAKQCVFILRNYPDLPEGFRKHLIGDIGGIVSFTNVKNINVTADFSDANAWKWIITWE